jgi:hypothetical protein
MALQKVIPIELWCKFLQNHFCGHLFHYFSCRYDVWDGADARLLAVYGFSIEIAKDNPIEKTIHLGGIKGHAIRQRYMDDTGPTSSALR